MSQWIQCIRKFALDNDISYGSALKDPKCSALYKANSTIKGGMLPAIKNTNVTQKAESLFNRSTKANTKVNALLDDNVSTTPIAQLVERPINILQPGQLMSEKQKEEMILAQREKRNSKTQERARALAKKKITPAEEIEQINQSNNEAIAEAERMIRRRAVVQRDKKDAESRKAMIVKGPKS